MHAKPLSLQARDLRLLLLLGSVGFLDTPTLHALFFPTDKFRKACLRRLRLLAGHGLIRSFPRPVPPDIAPPGRAQAVHCLTAEGAALARGLTGIERLRFPRSAPDPHRLPHQLGISRIMLALNLSAAQTSYPPPEWILEYDKNPGVPPDAPHHKRFVLYEQFKISPEQSLSCRPDASCRLVVPRPSSTARDELLLYLEYDRGTEMLRTVAEKVLPYHCLFAGAHPSVDAEDASHPLYRKHWPIPASPEPILRVLFVTVSEARRQHVAEAIRDLPGADAWRLATEQAITSPDFSLTAKVWYTPAGQAKSILTSPPPQA